MADVVTSNTSSSGTGAPQRTRRAITQAEFDSLIKQVRACKHIDEAKALGVSLNPAEADYTDTLSYHLACKLAAEVARGAVRSWETKAAALGKPQTKSARAEEVAGVMSLHRYITRTPTNDEEREAFPRQQSRYVGYLNIRTLARGDAEFERYLIGDKERKYWGFAKLDHDERERRLLAGKSEAERAAILKKREQAKAARQASATRTTM